ncbi:MAG: hypothetical protein IPI29_03265 [Ignavibacteria bacterium]|nr:hypothetical protein [Ignavibacteria bacterium]
MSNHKYCLIANAFVFLFVISAVEAVSQQIIGSGRHASILCVDGAVFSWGENRDGLLGDGTMTPSQEAVRSKVPPATRLIGRHDGVMAIDSDGRVYIWGGMTWNQFGMPSWEWREAMPQALPFVNSVRTATTSDANAYYHLRNGSVMVSGANLQGQYGNGTTTPLDSGCTPVPLDSVLDVFCDIATAYAVRQDGSIWAWGSNQENQIDSSTNLYYDKPRKMFQTPGVALTLGTSSGFMNVFGSMRVVTVDGDVWVWGQNDKNQLGVSNTKRVKVPTKIPMPGKVIAITGGLYHTVVLLENGTVWTWGDNGFGQLGNPYYNNTAEPVKAIGLANVVAIGSGSFSSYAIMRDGSLHGWGDNTYRQLNRDDAPRQYTAVPLPVPCGLVSGVAVDGQKTTTQSSPSPVIDILTIPIVEGSTRVEIFSIEGRTVHIVQPSPTDTMVRFDLSSESSGLYTIVRTRGNVVTTEVVIKY